MYIKYVYVQVFIHRVFDRHLVTVLMYVICISELQNCVTAEISSYMMYSDGLFLTLCFKTE
jgi:hypothetical protein